jgi:hypothetical protein
LEGRIRASTCRRGALASFCGVGNLENRAFAASSVFGSAVLWERTVPMRTWKGVCRVCQLKGARP